MKAMTKGISLLLIFALALGGLWFMSSDQEGGLTGASPLPGPAAPAAEAAPSRVSEPSQELHEGLEEVLPKAAEEEKTVPERPKPEPAKPDQTYRLLITEGYGQRTLLAEEIAYESQQNVMDALVLSGAQVETAYGGSFVQALEGRSSQGGSKRQDWFFFVNGTFADVGALDYRPLPGDLIWWDYHGWQPGQSSNAVIGAYPAPFIQGYEGQSASTLIVYAPASQNQAEALADSFRNLGVEVTLEAISQTWQPPRQGPTVVVGVWAHLSQTTYLAKLNEGVPRNGLFSQFQEDSISLRSADGQIQKTLTEEAGLIGALAQTGGDQSPLWLVAGLDEAGLEKMVQLMVENPGALNGCYSLALEGDQVYPLPLEDAQ